MSSWYHLVKSLGWPQLIMLPLQENKCNNANFHKTAIACTLHGNAAMQLRWGAGFISDMYGDHFWL